MKKIEKCLYINTEPMTVQNPILFIKIIIKTNIKTNNNNNNNNNKWKKKYIVNI